MFGEGAAELYYYFEAYHLLKNIPGRKYRTICHVENNNGKMDGKLLTSHLKEKRFDSIAEVGKINVSRLPTGTYRLLCGIADSAGTMLTSRDKRFFVYNPSLPVEAERLSEGAAGGLAVGPLQTLNEKELDDEFERMFYLTTRRERDLYKSLKGETAKRAFVSSIWQSPRAAAGLSGLAYREQYLARAREADARFKSPARPGWKSDRGRVFVLHGPADYVDRFPSAKTTLPYETWRYDNLQGQAGVLFVFVDRSGFNNYEQIHSTLQGELQDPDWQQSITRGSSGGNAIDLQ
jgi:GWxTD domain-containing protein